MTEPVTAAARRRRWITLRRPPTHWFALVVVLVVLVLMLSTATVLHGTDGPSRIGQGALEAPERTGPVLDLSGTTLRSGYGDGTSVGLAIVGLPDGATVDRLLDLLAGADATATWFVRGEDVVWRAEVVDRIHRSGSQLGLTGYSDADLRGEPAWRLRVQLSVSQAALAARHGVRSPLLLLPSTPTRASIDAASLRAARTAADEGYLLVAGTDAGSAAPGDVAVIVARDRGRRAISELQSLLDGTEQEATPVRTVGSAVGLERGTVNPRATGWTTFNGWLVLGAALLSDVVATILPLLFFPVTFLIGLRALATIGFGWSHSRRSPPTERWTGPVTVIVPAYNEAAGIEASVRSLSASAWAHGLEIIVVDDGSTDDTADIAEGLGLADVTVIRQENTGKPGALNTGIAASTSAVVVLVDGDTIFQPDTVDELVARFADERVGAVSGNAKVANRSSLLGAWQHIEYVMGFNLDRRLLDSLRAIATVPGAVGGFRRQALLAVGGVSDDTIAEDTDLTIALNRAGWEVVYEPKALAWTEAPSSAGDLWKQRYRWSYGILQSVWKHRRALVERHPIGPIGIPYTVVFQVLVGLVAPVVDVAALYALLTGSMSVVWAWLFFMFLQMVLAALAFRLDGESLRPLWAVPLQQVFYRQLMYLVVIQSVASAVAGARLRWHKPRRIGIGTGQDMLAMEESLRGSPRRQP